MNMLDNVDKVKQQMKNLLSIRKEKKDLNSAREFGDLLASLEVESMSEEKDETEEVNGVAFKGNGSLVNLWFETDYNVEDEEIIDSFIKRDRDLQSVQSTPISPSRRRRRRRGRKNWTHVKGRSRSRSVGSHSSTSGRSLSRTSVDQEVERIISNRQHYQLLRERNTRLSEWLEDSVMNCVVETCSIFFENVDVYNLHLIEHHGYMVQYFCDQCEMGFANKYLLQRHQKEHDTLPMICSMCLQELPNQVAYKAHQEAHASFSLSCQYCDKSFLTHKLYDQHQTEEHQHETKKGNRTRKKKPVIVDFVQYSSWHPDKVQRKTPSPSTLKVRCYSGSPSSGDVVDVTKENVEAHGETSQTQEQWVGLESSGLENGDEKNPGSSNGHELAQSVSNTR